MFHKFLKRFIECKFKIKSKFKKSFLEVFLVSFAAQILIVPVMVYCFNTISFTFFISNLMIYFFIGPILSLGYISLIFGAFLPQIGVFVSVFEEFLVQIILKIAEICSKLPFSKIYLPTPDFWMLIVYYAVIAFIIYLFQTKKIKFLRTILSDEVRKWAKTNRKRIIATGILVALVFNFVKIIPHDLKIYMVDVGQRRLLCFEESDWKKYYY